MPRISKRAHARRRRTTSRLRKTADMSDLFSILHEFSGLGPSQIVLETILDEGSMDYPDEDLEAVAEFLETVARSNLEEAVAEADDFAAMIREELETRA